jgi:hypothetical protein
MALHTISYPTATYVLYQYTGTHEHVLQVEP